MKNELISEFNAEVWAEVAPRVSLGWPSLTKYMVWAQQRPSQKSWKKAQTPSSRSSARRSKQAAEPFGGFDLAVQIAWWLHRHNQLVSQSLVRAFGVVMLEILPDRISHRFFTEQNQAINTLRFQ